MIKLPKIAPIKILEKENNKRGDLFGRLMNDLFLALGYNYVRLNIHKTGREVDVEAIHRTEKRRVVAECKATETEIGGDDINKFVGALDAEKRRGIETTGYYISLSGFKETAIEQEKEAGGERVILLNGMQVIEELIEGRIIVSPEKAMACSGRCTAEQSSNLVPEDAYELLAHEMGWIWAIYFTENKQRTHFALIHADGEALSPSLAQRIVEADKSTGGDLYILKYLSPPSDSLSDGSVNEAKEKYFRYLSKECGQIPLEGLPADQEVGSRRLDLEHIFIPLHLYPSTEREEIPFVEEGRKDKEKGSSGERISVGEVFSKCSRLAILADPGGGKTTLLKRLAIAYAFPERREAVDDKLPDQKWLPLFVRCRQIPNLAKSSVFDILSLIPNWAEMKELADSFSLLVSQALRDGRVLLLVDGLDEISDESERVAFIKQLRVFLSIYPAVGIIVTSREAGFRIIGGALSACCEHYRIADLDDNDIRRLTLAWHKEVVGDQGKVRLEAEKLVDTICKAQRVRALARNPLLLTTLLLVKRWVGQFPSRRSVLYGKAIEVLLMTWNVEGHKPIELDEAIPQLAFVAFAMMKDGVKRISLKRLNELLLLARNQMPDVLGYARISASEFVKQVELRSSILIFTGHTVEQGTLYPMYEFRHLTFQEYLTARAIVDGYYPGREDVDTIQSILEPHIEDSDWKEVVPLAAILAGRRAQPLIQYLIESCKKSEKGYHPHGTSSSARAADQLAQCFLDEVQVAPHILEKGLEFIARRSYGISRSHIRDLYKGKYGDVLLKSVQDAYTDFSTDIAALGSTLAEITLEQIKWNNELKPEKIEKITSLLESNDTIQQAAAALAAMEIAFSRPRHRTRADQTKKTLEEEKLFQKIGNAIAPLLYSEKPQLQFAASWAFAWLGENDFWSPKNSPDVLSRLLAIWRQSSNSDLHDKTGWAISELPIVDRKLNPFPKPDQELIEFIERWGSEKERVDRVSVRDFTERDYTERDYRERFTQKASIVIGFYLGKPWTDEELVKLVQGLKHLGHRLWSNGERILDQLGHPRETQLEQRKGEGIK